MKQILALVLMVFGLVGCSYSEEEKQMIETKQAEMTELLREIVECSATEGNVYLNHAQPEECYRENMGGLIIKSNIEKIQFNCYISSTNDGKGYPVCRIEKGMNIISTPFREGYLGSSELAGQCLNINEVEAVNECADLAKKNSGRYFKDLDTLSDHEASRDIGLGIENACADSFNKALQPYTSDIKNGIFRYTRLKSKESEELARKIRKKIGDIEIGIYHCECILYEHISKKDYAPEGLISWQNSVGIRPGYGCNGPNYEKR